MNIKIRENEYSIEKDEGKTVNDLNLEEIVTDYYDSFDYIVGDWAYGKVRLKGFYEKGNSNLKSYNDISKLDEYLKNNCAYGCKYFVLKKIIKAVEKKD